MNTIPKKVKIFLRKSEEPDEAGISIHSKPLYIKSQAT